jgi:RNA polymerase sigma-70 factor (ECF subfamily)
MHAATTERFRRLFEEEHGRVFRFVYSMVGASEVARELTQETFVRAFRSFDSYEERSAASTWLCGIARNVVLNHLRSQKQSLRLFVQDEEPERSVAEAQPAPDRELLSRELRDAIRAALLTLDDDKRVAFTLKVLEGLSYEAIAAVTGSAIAKLKTDVHRARLQLRAALAGYVEER